VNSLPGKEDPMGYVPFSTQKEPGKAKPFTAHSVREGGRKTKLEELVNLFATVLTLSHRSMKLS
jgi:hypothetical protein